MRGSWLLIAAAAACALPAQAAEREPLEQWRDWRLVGVDEGGNQAVFLASVVRAGSAAQFEVLTVYKDVQGEQYKYDKELETLLADCGARTYRRIGYRFQVGDEATPPPIFRLSPAQAVEQGTMADGLLSAACAADPLNGRVVEAPYAWAKAQLAKAK
ncbi:MAG TPA: hypothetical protein VF727_07955 [Allosphingosinicella sp.]|jgi:hypothetical protein